MSAPEILLQLQIFRQIVRSELDRGLADLPTGFGERRKMRVNESNGQLGEL
jgi:hypothetical protein